MNHAVRRFALLLALPFLAGGCFSYRTVDISQVTVDDHVRTRVTGAEADRLARILGRDDRVVSGTVAGLFPDTLLLRVTAPTRPNTMAPAGLRQNVGIPTSVIQEVEIRSLDRGRTAGLVAGTVALMGFIVYQAFVRGDPAGGPGENPPPVNQLRRPRGLTIPVRVP